MSQANFPFRSRRTMCAGWRAMALMIATANELRCFTRNSVALLRIGKIEIHLKERVGWRRCPPVGGDGQPGGRGIGRLRSSLPAGVPACSRKLDCFELLGRAARGWRDQNSLAALQVVRRGAGSQVATVVFAGDLAGADEKRGEKPVVLRRVTKPPHATRFRQTSGLGSRPGSVLAACWQRARPHEASGGEPVRYIPTFQG